MASHRVDQWVDGSGGRRVVYVVDLAVESYGSGFRYVDAWDQPLSIAFLWFLGILAACPLGALEGLAMAVLSLPLIRAPRSRSCPPIQVQMDPSLRITR